jgi:hypothetical protein
VTEDCDLDARLSLRADTVSVSSESFKMTVTVSPKYTEDRIFSRWAKEMQSLYVATLANDCAFASLIAALQTAITKPNGHYVLNLSIEDCPDVASWEDSNIITQAANLLCSFHDVERLSLLKGVLYQVRCNIFHGEKVPGDMNDDRIVRAAVPVLQRLIELTRASC